MPLASPPPPPPPFRKNNLRWSHCDFFSPPLLNSILSCGGGGGQVPYQLFGVFLWCLSTKLASVWRNPRCVCAFGEWSGDLQVRWQVLLAFVEAVREEISEFGPDGLWTNLPSRSSVLPLPAPPSLPPSELPFSKRKKEFFTPHLFLCRELTFLFFFPG